MKKGILQLSAIIISILLCSCTQSTLKKAIEQGKLFIAAGDYSAALSSLQLAKNEGAKSDELDTMMEILEVYMSAQDFFDKGEYFNAQQKLNDMPQEYSQYTIKTEVDKLKEDTTKHLSGTATDEGADIVFTTQKPVAEDNSVKATYYVVKCDEYITLRTNPSTSATEITKIPLGAQVGYISSASNGFYKVEYNGNIGYALSSYLSTTPQIANGAVVKARVVNAKEYITLRINPSTSAKEITKIPAGATVRFLNAASNGFYKIEYGGYEGYALASYLYLEY